MTKPPNPWDLARKIEVIRGSDLCPPKALEPGVRFFVLMLEQLGCKTFFSCEGHPAGFYITFNGRIAIARRIVRCGFMTVMVEWDGYRMSLSVERLVGIPTTKVRNGFLRAAAESWCQEFGPLARVEAVTSK
jgi:hypothetical protein